MSIMKEIPLVHKGQNMCWMIYKSLDFEKKGSLNLDRPNTHEKQRNFNMMVWVDHLDKCTR